MMFNGKFVPARPILQYFLNVTSRVCRYCPCSLEQMETEPSAWMIRGEEEKLEGIRLTYVDDVLILAQRQNAKLWAEKISTTWETTKPEWIGAEVPTRFLGM